MVKKSEKLEISPEALHALQNALESYIQACQAQVEPFLESQLHLKDCFEIQKRFIFRDLALGPINAIWCIPYLSLRKVIEACEKLGWQSGHRALARIPQAVKTGFQKEVEQMVGLSVFGLLSDRRSPCKLSEEIRKEAHLVKNFSESQIEELIENARAQILLSLREFSSKQNSFTDFAASAGLFLTARLCFGDSNLNIFGISQKVAAWWARRDAVSHFAFGKSLGQAFYSVAKAPPPSNWQILMTTLVGILLLALLSTAVGILSFPLQHKLGFRKGQLLSLVATVSDRLLLETTKTLKKQSVKEIQKPA